MAQLTVLISSTDTDFRAHVTKCLRASGTSVALVDERHATANPPSLAIVDIRQGARTDAIERLRASWPSATIFAIASSAQPEQILQAMRAGANEYLAWPHRRLIHGGHPHGRPNDRGRRTARAPAACCRSSASKGGAGTTTIAVNSAIEIARTSKKPTLIIDLHQFIGEVALFLGVRPRFTLVDALDNLHRIDAEFLRELVVKHKTGLDILAGGEQADRPGPQDAAIFEQLLQTLGRSYDYIIIDAGLVTGPCSDVAVFAADSIYLVANPDIASRAQRASRRRSHGPARRRQRSASHAAQPHVRPARDRAEADREHARRQPLLGVSERLQHGVGGAELRRAAHAEQSLGAGGAVRRVHQTNRVSKSDRRRLRISRGRARRSWDSSKTYGCSSHHSHTARSRPRRARPPPTRGARSTSKCAAPCTASC